MGIMSEFFREEKRREKRRSQSSSAAAGNPTRHHEENAMNFTSIVHNPIRARHISSGEHHEFKEDRCSVCHKFKGYRNLGVFHTCPSCVNKNYGFSGSVK